MGHGDLPRQHSFGTTLRFESFKDWGGVEDVAYLSPFLEGAARK